MDSPTDLEAIEAASALPLKVKLAVCRKDRRKNYEQALRIDSLQRLNAELMKENQRLTAEIDALQDRRSRVMTLIREAASLSKTPQGLVIRWLEDRLNELKDKQPR